MKKISIVIPMYYEEEVVKECYSRLKMVILELKDYEYEIIFINDGSKDKTLELLTQIASEDKNVKIVSLNIIHDEEKNVNQFIIVFFVMPKKQIA